MGCAGSSDKEAEPPDIEMRLEGQQTPVVTTDNIVQVEADPEGLWLYLDRDGTERLEEVSGANVGRRLEIYIDGEFATDPVIRERIPGGKVQITLSDGPRSHLELARRFGVEVE
jgi:preprotein translocase subunit SecD